MKKKLQYNAPEMEVVKVNVEVAIMNTSVNSVESMNRVNGTWDLEQD